MHHHRNCKDLLRDAAAHARRERDGRDLLIVDIAEIDARRVYREAGYPSTIAFCIFELGLSRKAALHRIHVARVAWRMPAILSALIAGRVHLTAVSMLAAHFTEENVEELLESVEDKNMRELRALIAERFPRRDLFTGSVPPELELVTVPSPMGPAAAPSRASGDRAPEPLVGRPSSVAVAMPPERFVLKVALARETHAKLARARDLLGHQVPSGDTAEVLDRVLEAFIAHAEKRKFAVSERPRAVAAPSFSRHIPAEVWRAVAERDAASAPSWAPAVSAVPRAARWNSITFSRQRGEDHRRSRTSDSVAARTTNTRQSWPSAPTS
jgi:hypothetical protein